MRKNFFLIMLLSFLVLFTRYSFAQEQTITVTGKGDVRVTPDIVYLYVGIETIAATPGEAIKQNSILIENLKKKIVSFNIKLENVKTINYYLHRKIKYIKGEEIFKGFCITNVLEVPVDEVSKAGEILDGLMASGVNIVQGVEFTIKDRKAVEKEILRQAVNGARLKAEDIAKEIGYKVGEIDSIKENYSSPAYWGAEGGASEQYAGPFVPGQLKVEGTVDVTYRLVK